MTETTEPPTNGDPRFPLITDVTVTVVIPFCETYTPRSMLKEAIESVEQQTKVDTEILVVEDEEERGPAWARNIGLDRAKTRYVAFLDADDTWFESKLLTQLQVMKNTGAGLCVDGTTKYSEIEFIRALLTAETFGLTSSILVDTKRTSARFDESLERREDHLYLIEAAADAGICFVPETFHDRSHEDGFSNHVNVTSTEIEIFFLKVVDRVPKAARFRQQYYQNAYVNLGRANHFAGEYRLAIGYFIKSLRYGPSIQAVGAIALTILRMLYEYSTQSMRQVLPRGVKE